MEKCGNFLYNIRLLLHGRGYIFFLCQNVKKVPILSIGSLQACQMAQWMAYVLNLSLSFRMAKYIFLGCGTREIGFSIIHQIPPLSGTNFPHF